MEREIEKPIAEKNAYHIRLHQLEERFSIDLIASKNVDISHVFQARGLGHKVIDWTSQFGISAGELERRHQAVGKSLVLVHKEHMSIVTAIAKEGLHQLDHFWSENVSKMTEEDVALSTPRYKFFRESYLHDLERYIGTENVPVGSSVSIELRDGTEENIFIVSDWEEVGVYGVHSIEATIVEEALHLMAKMHGTKMISSKAFSVPMQFEEMAIEWYVRQALRELGIGEEIIENNSLTNPGLADIWGRFIDKEGAELAHAIFFMGDASNDQWMALFQHYQLELDHKK